MKIQQSRSAAENHLPETLSRQKTLRENTRSQVLRHSEVSRDFSSEKNFVVYTRSGIALVVCNPWYRIWKLYFIKDTGVCLASVKGRQSVWQVMSTGLAGAVSNQVSVLTCYHTAILQIPFTEDSHSKFCIFFHATECSGWKDKPTVKVSTPNFCDVSLMVSYYLFFLYVIYVTSRNFCHKPRYTSAYTFLSAMLLLLSVCVCRDVINVYFFF